VNLLSLADSLVIRRRNRWRLIDAIRSGKTGLTRNEQYAEDNKKKPSAAKPKSASVTVPAPAPAATKKPAAKPSSKKPAAKPAAKRPKTVVEPLAEATPAPRNWWVGAGGDGEYAESRANARRAMNHKLIELGMLDAPTPQQDNDAWWTTQHAMQNRFR